MFFLLCQAFVTAYLLLNTVEIAATFLALFQEQVLSVKYDGLGALDLCEDRPVFRGMHEVRCITSGLGVKSPHMTDLRIGTSAFIAAGWEGAFYPAGMKPAEFLSYYATKFDTVEVDSTFYRTPSVATVNGWARKVPEGFLLAAKVPQVITHESVLQDCDDDLEHFLETMDLMGNKLGPLLFQFGYFNRTVFRSSGDFLARLEPFLAKLPNGYKCAVEIRNKNWLSKAFFDLLRAHKVAYALIGGCHDRARYSRSLIPSRPTSHTYGCWAIERVSRSKRGFGIR